MTQKQIREDLELLQDDLLNMIVLSEIYDNNKQRHERMQYLINYILKKIQNELEVLENEMPQ